MDMYNFFITDDDSVGLYSESANDILHSKTGAKKEAYDKFVNPISESIKEYNDLKILDLCTGCGYNLKVIITHLKNKKAKIDAIDINKEFVVLSLLIHDNLGDIDLKLHLFSQMLFSGIKFLDIYNIYLKLFKEKKEHFLDADICALIEKIYSLGNKITSNLLQDGFLHNIYYSYISSREKTSSNSTVYKDIKIGYKINDARFVLNDIFYRYDFIFLDGFSPHKDPTLWTIDFLSMLKSKLHEKSIITSYSKSTAFRSALLYLNFFVGKTFVDDVDMGTVASLNKKNIKHILSDFDINLINTTSGIPYRDPDFTYSPSEIISNRNLEQKNSSRQSTTSFFKNII